MNFIYFETLGDQINCAFRAVGFIRVVNNHIFSLFFLMILASSIKLISVEAIICNQSEYLLWGWNKFFIWRFVDWFL